MRREMKNTWFDFYMEDDREKARIQDYERMNELYDAVYDGFEGKLHRVINISKWACIVAMVAIIFTNAHTI